VNVTMPDISMNSDRRDKVATMLRPAWATATESNDSDGLGGYHTALITVGDGTRHLSDAQLAAGYSATPWENPVQGLPHHEPLTHAGQAAYACIEINQSTFEDGRVWPMGCDVGNWEDCDAQTCRDLAAALLKAAQILDDNISIYCAEPSHADKP